MLGNLLAVNSRDLENPARILTAYATTREGRVQRLSKFSDNFAMLHTARMPYGLGPFLRWLLYTLVPTWFWISYLKWLYGYQPFVEAGAIMKRKGDKGSML